VRLREQARQLARDKRAIAIIVGASILIAALASLLTPLRYEAQAQLYVSVSSESDATPADLDLAAELAKQKIKSYVFLVNSTELLERAIDRDGLSTTVGELSSRVRGWSPLDTVVMFVIVQDSDQQRAADIANGLASDLANTINDVVEKPEDGGAGRISVNVVETARAPAVPVAPNVPLNLGVGLLVGLVLGVVYSSVRAAIPSVRKAP